MGKLLLVPSWAQSCESIYSGDAVFNHMELQADFFNWIYKSGLNPSTARLPSASPVVLFRSFMANVFPEKDASPLYDRILNLVERPINEVDIPYIYGEDMSSTDLYEWAFKRVGDNLTFCMRKSECDHHTFMPTDEVGAKVAFCEALFAYYEKQTKLAQVDRGHSQFEDRPILTSFYAAHVTAKNSKTP